MKVDWVRLIPRLLADREQFDGKTLEWAVVFPQIWFSLGWHEGGYPLLGWICENWASGHLVELCPECGSEAYLLTARTYRIFAGDGVWTGVCLTCNKVVSGESHLWYMARIPGFKDNVVKTIEYKPAVKLVGEWSSFLRKRPDIQVDGNNEQRFFVPSWDEFLRSRYPDFLIDDEATGRS